MSPIINPFKLLTLLISLLFLNACSSEKIIIRIINGEVSAAIETDPTPASDDTADDPCVWVHPTNPSLSVIIGTDKVLPDGVLNGFQPGRSGHLIVTDQGLDTSAIPQDTPLDSDLTQTQF